MANFSENYGLDFLMDDSAVSGFLGHIIEKGKCIRGYYGYPYFYEPFGDVEYWIKTESDSKGELTVAAIDSHCGGDCVWDMVCTGIDITPKSFAKLGRTLILSRTDGSGGMLPVDLITADVLPSFSEGDRITAQVIGLPLNISYYANEDEYAADQPEDKNGKKWMMAVNSMCPLSFLVNHDPDKYEQGKEYDTDAYVHFAATVTGVYHGAFELDGNRENMFIRCCADTQYGPIEFDHTIDQVDEDQRKNIKVGSVVSGICILSGDVAINEYENGAVKDLKHDLMLLGYSVTDGDCERLRSVLTDDTVFYSEASGNELRGSDSIIEMFKQFKAARGGSLSAHSAEVASVDGETEYPVGTRCILISCGEEDSCDAALFIDVSREGMIERIEASNDGRYRFKIDDPSDR